MCFDLVDRLQCTPANHAIASIHMNELAEFSTLAIALIALLFFILALTYSSVGLGGGSAYTASMVVLGFSAALIPPISLSLNILVTSISSYQFIRNGHASARLLLPFLLSSMPMAYVGGALQLPVAVFQWLLLVSLLFAMLRLYVWDSVALQLKLNRRMQLLVSLLAGSLLGLIAGIVGIGGGIYLVPLILILGLGTAKQAAACGAVFVWVNSVVGLVSRMQHNPVDLGPYLPLLLAVVTGGALGSWLGAVKLPARTVEKVLGLVITVAMLMLANSLIFVR